MSDPVVMVDLTCRTAPYDRRLCEGLCAEGKAVELWASGCHSEELKSADLEIRRGWSDLVVDLPVESVRIGRGLKAIEYGINLLALAYRAHRDSPSVIHFQWLPLLELGPGEIYLLRLLRNIGIAVVYTVHDMLPLDSPNDAAVFDRYRRVYQEVDGLICHTPTSKTRLQREFGINAGKIWCIPHGPLQPRGSDDTEDVAPSSFVENVDSSERLVLLFGVLRPYKGYKFLLRAWPRVVREVKNTRLVIAGRASSSVQEEIEQSIRERDVAASVSTVYRYLSDAELSSLIEAADVLVYPYQNITQSGALFTGMKAGKPIVATRVGGLDETLRDRETGRLVTHGDEEALARTLTELLTDPEQRHRLGEAVQHDVQRRLSWREIARKTMRCYRTVAST